MKTNYSVVKGQVFSCFLLYALWCWPRHQQGRKTRRLAICCYCYNIFYEQPNLAAAFSLHGGAGGGAAGNSVFDGSRKRRLVSANHPLSHLTSNKVQVTGVTFRVAWWHWWWRWCRWWWVVEYSCCFVYTCGKYSYNCYGGKGYNSGLCVMLSAATVACWW